MQVALGHEHNKRSSNVLLKPRNASTPALNYSFIHSSIPPIVAVFQRETMLYKKDDVKLQVEVLAAL